MILLVDDDVQLLRANEQTLLQAGFVCMSEPYPASALILVRDGLVPELLITDYNMPGMNGVELATEIRKLVPDVPILFHSGDYKQEMDAFQNSVFLRKCCWRQDLVREVNWLLGKERDE
jgi:DNA-binding response OmpR family regulator